MISPSAHKCKLLQIARRANAPEIHLEDFPYVTKYYRNHEFDREERVDYHFL